MTERHSQPAAHTRPEAQAEPTAQAGAGAGAHTETGAKAGTGAQAQAGAKAGTGTQAQAGARAEVLARIRRALGDGPRPAAVVARDYRRAGEHPPGAPALLDLLADRLVDYRATVLRSTAGALPATIAAALARVLPAGGRVLVPPGLPDAWAPADAVLDDGLDWAALDAVDAVLTGCAAAAAETGTIVLDGSPDQGRRAITLIPDRHVCVVRADQVVQTVPELLARLDPLRPLTFVSGPSATSDIELNRVEGVHGPRTLVVILVTGSA